MIRQSAGGNSRLSMCVMLKQSNTRAGQGGDEKRRSDAIRIVAQKIKNNDPNMLRARADAARLGLYGFKQDSQLAFSLYKKARSPDAGFDAALMLYRGSDITRNPQVAKNILDLLYKSGAAAERSRGAVGAQAHYIAGLIQEGGYAGKVDMKKTGRLDKPVDTSRTWTRGKRRPRRSSLISALYPKSGSRPQRRSERKAMQIVKDLWTEQSVATKIAFVNIQIIILAVTVLLFVR